MDGGRPPVVKRPDLCLQIMVREREGGRRRELEREREREIMVALIRTLV